MEVTDAGGGVGRIEWRVNGLTVGVEPPAGALDGGGSRRIKRVLALDIGENYVEVVASNGAGQLASPPVRTSAVRRGGAEQAKPRLHALLLGINTYSDAFFTALSYSRRDAETLAGALQSAGRDLYASVEVTLLLDDQATIPGLEQAFARIGAKAHPRDTFILYAAGHGKSVQGRFQIVPQDFRTDTGPEQDIVRIERSLIARGIGQERLQSWIARYIPTRRGLILLDTCESGALVAAGSAGRRALSGSEAAIGRLHEAIGHPVLTAAGGAKEALEGYRGHGVFTYAVLEALVKGDFNRDGIVSVDELATHVRASVPRLAKLVPGFADFQQNPRLGSARGESFPVIKALPSHPSVDAK